MKSDFQIRELQEENEGLREKMSTMLDNFVVNMKQKLTEFVTMDKNVRLMIDKVQTVLMFQLITESLDETENEGGTPEDLDAHKLHHMLNDLSK